MITKFKSENLKGREHLGRPKRRWKDNNIDLRETGCVDVDWMAQQWQAFCEHGNKLLGPIKGGEFPD
jgi:hypothetical protein